MTPGAKLVGGVTWALWGGPYDGQRVVLQPDTNAVRLPPLQRPDWAGAARPSVEAPLAFELYAAHETRPHTLRWRGTKRVG